jgi:hypothetical protein
MLASMNSTALGRRQPAGAVHADRDAGGLLGAHVAVHAQRHLHIFLRGEAHLGERHGLDRLLRLVPQHGCGPQSDFGASGGGRRAGRVTLGGHDLMQRCGEIRVRARVHHDCVHAAPTLAIHAHDGPDPKGRVRGGPEVELVWTRRQRFGRDYAPDRHHQPPACARKNVSTW